MTETNFHFRDIPTAEATMQQNTIDIQNKIKESKRITTNSNTQKELLKEFLQTRKEDPKTQAMIQIFKWKREQEKDGTEFDIPRMTKHNVVAVSESKIREGKSRSIGNYMKGFEQQKQYSFTKEDISEITQSIIDIVNNFLATGNTFFSQSDGILSEPKQYKEYLQSNHLQKKVVDFVDNKRTIAAINSVTDLLNWLVRDYGRDDLNCKVEDRKEIAKKHLELVMGFVALSGDIQKYEAFKNNQKFYSGSESRNYDTMKKINIFKGNLDDAIIASYSYNAPDLNKIIHGREFYDKTQNPHGSPRRSDLSGDELETLSRNVAHNQKKEKVLHEIYHIIQDINKALGEKKYKEDDFRVYDENQKKRGEEGQNLYAQSYGDIMSAKERFEAELKSLKQEKKEGLGSITGSVQNNLAKPDKQ